MNDLISRRAAIDKLEHKALEPDYYHKGEDWYDGMNSAVFELDDVPSADVPDTNVGEWIEMGENEDGTHNVKCNQCDSAYKMRGHARSINTRYKYRFCPHCGMRMKGADDET